MRESFFGWILGGALACVALPGLLVFGLGSYYLDLQLEVGPDRFFHGALDQASSWERTYTSELEEIETMLKKELKKFKKNAHKTLSPSLYRKPTDLWRSPFPFLSDYARDLEPPFRRKHLLSLKRVRRLVLKKFPNLSSADLFMQYYGLEVPLQFAQANSKVDVNLASIALLKLDPQETGALEQIFQSLVILVLRKRVGMETAKRTFEAMRHNFAYDYEKSKFEFFTLYFRPLALRLMLGDIPLSKEGREALGLVSQKIGQLDKIKNLPRGCLCVALNVQNLFPRMIKRLSRESPLSLEKTPSTYSISSIPSTGFQSSTSLSVLSDIKLLERGGRKEQEISLSRFQKELYVARRTLRFSYTAESGERRFGISFPDSVLRGFIHFFSIGKSELVASHQRLLDFVQGGMLVLLFAFLCFATLLTFRFSRPLRDFALRVGETSIDLDPRHIEDFSHNFIEFGIMRNTFLAKVRNLSLRFQRANALADLQSRIHDNPSTEEFLVTLRKTFRECFELDFLGYEPALREISFSDHKIVLEHTDSPQQGDAIWDFQGKGEGIEPFHEQVRFFFEKKSLEENFKLSLKTEREFEISRQIQRELLPKVLPHTPYFEVVSYYQPATTLGGDFFDHQRISDSELFVIADVSGKGLGAALYASFIKALLHAFCLSGMSLNKAIGNLHEALEGYGAQDFFCTLFLLKLDPQASSFQYCSAGHNRMILIRDSDPLFLSGKGLPVGIISGPEHSLESMDLLKGDLIFLYTDGVTELEGSGGDLFGEARLLEILVPGSKDSPEELKVKLVEELSDFSYQGQLSDDVTFLILKIGN
ncbi:serine/threonine-protein phosphatase [bacterium]|nr:serine/threonine-protein phosphatase [bacterium]